jgi:hypothetical protein
MMVVLHSLQIIGACNVGDADSEILSGRAVNGRYGVEKKKRVGYRGKKTIRREVEMHHERKTHTFGAVIARV